MVPAQNLPRTWSRQAKKTSLAKYFIIVTLNQNVVILKQENNFLGVCLKAKTTIMVTFKFVSTAAT